MGQYSGSSPVERSRQIWVILISAPLLWMGFWLITTSVWARLTGEVSGARKVAWQLGPCVRLTTDVCLMLWVLLVLRKSGRGLRELGLKSDWGGREILIGALAAVTMWAISLVPFWAVGFERSALAPTGLLAVRAPMRILYLSIAAVCEEVVWRGYAITALHRLYRLSVSVFIATMSFAAFHLGDAVVFDWLKLPVMLYLGGGLSLLFLWRRSLIAPIVARFVFSGLALA